MRFRMPNYPIYMPRRMKLNVHTRFTGQIRVRCPRGIIRKIPTLLPPTPASLDGMAPIQRRKHFPVLILGKDISAGRAREEIAHTPARRLHAPTAIMMEAQILLSYLMTTGREWIRMIMSAGFPAHR